MAKTAKLKKSTKPSTHSRASRRASSPALEGNVDKSLTNAPRPSTSKSNILAQQIGAGISKPAKKRGGKILKRKQKLRLEQGKEKAEAVNGKLERKVERAEQMRVGRKGRNADWDEMNERITGRKRMQKDKSNKEEQEWEDEEMEVDDEGGVTISKVVPKIEESEHKLGTGAIVTDGVVEDQIE